MNSPAQKKRYHGCGQPSTLDEEEVPMYITDIVWWSYTAWIAAVAVFLLVFAFKVREKGG